jgi:signal transduction histidine kinase
MNEGAAHNRRDRAQDGQESIARMELAQGWRIVSCNAALADLLGAAGGVELTGRLLVDFVGDRILLDKLLADVRARRKPAGAEMDLTRLDGGSVPAVVVLDGAFGEGLQLVSLSAMLVEASDTGRRNLLGAQRMEAIGRLAGGIAHDFNNLLMVISGHAELLLDAAPEEKPFRNSAKAIQQATHRAASLTRQLLAFSRRQMLQARPTELHRLVTDLRPRLHGALRHAVDLQLELAEVPHVNVDAVRLADALASLVINACDAMPRGGSVTIRTDTETVSDRAPRPRRWIRPGSYARLVVTDTGHGMNEATKLHVFEPFFTTRTLGSGAGLGLSTVYGFVKQSGGYIFVDSEVERGASFTILLPIVSHAGGAGRAAKAAVFETILVVGDDEAVRTGLGDALRLEGYHVLDSPSGERAAEVFAAYTDRVHLLLVDTGDQGEAGRMFVDRLRAIDPLLQAVYLIEPAVEPAGRRAPIDQPFVLKPFSVDAVIARVRDVLDTGEGR